MNPSYFEHNPKVKITECLKCGVRRPYELLHVSAYNLKRSDFNKLMEGCLFCLDFVYEQCKEI